MLDFAPQFILFPTTDNLRKTNPCSLLPFKFCPLLQELGISVLSDLQRQRESILHSRDTLGTVDANISKARDVLSVMSRRIVQNKLIMWGVIALLAGAIGLILWAKIA